VNNFGHVTGWAEIGSTTRIFVYTPTAGSSDIGDIGYANTSYGGYGINDSDVIVGQYPINSAIHAFRWDGGLQDITINQTNQPTASGYAAAINAAGDIGGTLTFNCNGGAATPFMAARWAPGGGSVVSLGTYDLCSTSSVLALNNVGDLAGYAYRVIAGANWMRATVWHAGTMIELPNFGTSPGHAVVSSINDSGVGVGWAESRAPTQWYAPCLWTAAGALVNLNPPGHETDGGEAMSINNAGLVVGWSGATLTIWTAPGVPLSLMSRIVAVPPNISLADISLTEAVAISNSGFVVCNGARVGSGFSEQAFLLAPCTPVILAAAPDQTVPTMTPVTFSLTAVGAGPITYQWRKDGVNLSNGFAAGGGVIAGATTSTLTITPAACPDRGVYACLITTACGSDVWQGAVLNVTGCTCTADFNNDGDVGTDADIAAFFACVAGNCCQSCGSADFNGDGDVGTDADLEAFWRVLGGGPCG
jgi:hypothetical protein